MKKNIYLLVYLSLLLISCSQDSTEETIPKEDPIIGVWKLTSYYARPLIGYGDRIYANECHQKSRLTFNKNGTYTRVSIDQNCKAIEEMTYNGNWSNNGLEGEYTFTPSITKNIYFDYPEIEGETPDNISFHKPGAFDSEDDDKEEMEIFYKNVRAFRRDLYWYVITYERVE